MAFGYDLKIKIRFNEHDDEEYFVKILRDNLKDVCKKLQKGDHKDVFIDIEWDLLKEYSHRKIEHIE